MDESGERIIRGIPVSPGVCRGKILVLGKSHDDSIPKHHVAERKLPDEVRRLEQKRSQVTHLLQTLTCGEPSSSAPI